MRNARLEEAQAGIKIAGRNIKNLIYEDDNTLMAESECKWHYFILFYTSSPSDISGHLNISQMVSHFWPHKTFINSVYSYLESVVPVAEGN